MDVTHSKLLYYHIIIVPYITDTGGSFHTSGLTDLKWVDYRINIAPRITDTGGSFHTSRGTELHRCKHPPTLLHAPDPNGVAHL